MIGRRCHRHGAFEAENRKAPCPTCEAEGRRIDAALRSATKADLVAFIRERWLIGIREARALETVTTRRKLDAAMNEMRRLQDEMKRTTGAAYLVLAARWERADAAYRRESAAWQRRHDADFGRT